LKGSVGGHVRENRQIILDEHQVLPSVSWSVLYETVTVQLQYGKIWATWVLKMLTDEHKQKNGRKQLLIG
jgi:hypothetical protein